MKPISREFAWLIMVLIAFCTGLAFHKFVWGVVNVQALNMEMARESIPKAQAMLAMDKRFKDVTPFVYTGQGGALGFGGTVDKEEDLIELLKAVAAERFHVTIHWGVKTLPE